MNASRTAARRRWRAYAADGLLLLALCLFFFWRDLTPAAADRLPFAAGDFYDQFVAFAQEQFRRLGDGQLPLWTPHINAGHPFLADVQAAVWYPPRLLTAWLGAVRDVAVALQGEAVLHFPLVAWGMYLLARRLTRRRIGGLVAAIAFTFSGYLTGYPILQLAVLETQAWWPLVLLGLDVAAARLAAGQPGRALRWAVAAGLALGLALLAGHPQSALLVVYGSAAFAAVRVWPRRGAGVPWRRLATVAAFLPVGLGLAAAQWLPSLELMRLSTRADLSFAEAGSGFTPYDMLQLVLPAVGVPVPALYLGVLPLGLALAAVAARFTRPLPAPDRRMVLFLAGAALLALLLSFGRHLPVYALFYLLVPGWDLFRHQERTIVWAVLAAALLAGYGAAWLARADWTRRLARAYGLGAAAAAALALLCFIGYQTGQAGLWGFTAAFLWLALLAGLAGLAVISRRPALLMLLIVLDLFTVNPANHQGAAAVPPAAASLLAIPRQDGSDFRVANEGVLPGNFGAAYGVEATDSASPLQLADYAALWQQVPRARVWQLLNVGYVLSARATLDAPAERLAEATDAGGQTVYLHRLAQPGPRAWLVADIEVEPDAQRLWSRLAAPDFDPQRVALLPAPLAGGLAGDGACGGDSAWAARQPEHLALDVTATRACLLVLSEVYYPGWRAAVDGAPVALHKADGVLRALVVPAGSHRVTLSFRPALVVWGGAVSLLTLLAALTVLVWRRR